MILQLTHRERDATLWVVGVSDWQQSDGELTVFLPVDRTIDIQQELTTTSWCVLTGTDSESYTDAFGTPTEYLCEVIELGNHAPDETVWVIPSESFPVLSDGWESFYPSEQDVEQVLA